jgi:hypothetical protein
MPELKFSFENGKLVIADASGAPLTLAAPPPVDPPPVDPPPVDPPPVDPPPPPPVDPPVTVTGIWIGPGEIATLPTSGAGWTEVDNAANAAGTTSLNNQDSPDSTRVVAAAYKYARTGDTAARDKVLKAARDIATGTLESGSRALALGRELLGYIVACDVVDLATLDPALDAKWRTKLAYLLTYKTSQAGSLIDCSLDRPNNWGGHSIASWIAGALYLGDTAGVERAAKVLKGWCGDRASYAGFTYGELTWQVDKAHPVGVLPVGAVIDGKDVSGGQPEELRRGADAQMYSWESLQGRIAAAYMLKRAGYTDVWEWCDKALLRAVEFNYRNHWPAAGDDRWLVPIINQAYGTTFAASGGVGGAGKNIGWTLWTHA